MITEQTDYKDFLDRLHYCNYYRKEDIPMNPNDIKILVDGVAYDTHGIVLDADYNGTTITASAYLTPSINCTTLPGILAEKYHADAPAEPLTIENVIFNPPATIVFWSDKTKTIVKCDYDYESYDPEKGIAMAIAKKMMGDNKGSYYEMFKHWRMKWNEQNETKSKLNTPKTPLNDLSEKIKSMFDVPKEVFIDDLIP